MTDEALVIRARAGDELAFRRLAERCDDLIEFLARDYFIPGGSREDIRQEALIGLTEAVAGWCHEGGGSFRTFARLCILREVQTAITTARRLKRHPGEAPLSLDAPGGGESDTPLGHRLPSPAPSPDLQLEEQGRLEAVQGVLDQCTKQERIAALGVGEGYSYQEISTASGMSTKSIDNALQRCRRKLAPVLEAAA